MNDSNLNYEFKSSLATAMFLLQTPSSALNDRLDALRLIQKFIATTACVDPSVRRQLSQLIMDNVLQLLMSEDRITDSRKRQLVRVECFLMLAKVLNSKTLYGNTKSQLDELQNGHTNQFALAMQQPRDIATRDTTVTAEMTRPSTRSLMSPALRSAHVTNSKVEFLDGMDAPQSPRKMLSKSVSDLTLLKPALLKGTTKFSRKFLKPRPSVFVSNEYVVDAIVPGVDPTNWLEQDRKLGYQKSRMWFPMAGIGLNNGMAPNKRNEGSGKFSSDRIVEEFLQVRAMLSYVGDLVAPSSKAQGNTSADPARNKDAKEKETGGEEKKRGRFAAITDPRRYDEAVREAVHIWSPLLGANLPDWARSVDNRYNSNINHNNNNNNNKKRSVNNISGIEDDDVSLGQHSQGSASLALSDASSASTRTGPGLNAGAMNMPAEQNIVFTKGVLRRLLRKEILCNTKTHEAIRDSLHGLTQGSSASLARDAMTKCQRRINSSMEDEKHTYAETAGTLQTLLHETIQLQYAMLPSRYLLVVEGSKANSRQLVAKTFFIFCRVRRHNLLSMAIGIWKICLVTAESVARRPVYARNAAAHMMHSWVQNRKFKKLRMWTTRWQQATTWLIFCERNACAIPIQTLYRTWRDRRKLRRMHTICPFNGPLSDIYLAPFRPSLKYSIPKFVRDARRMLWLAAIIVQSSYRRLVEWRVYLFRRHQVTLLQSISRMWPIYCWFRRLRATAVKVQAWMRRTVRRNLFTRLKRATIMIQKYVRRYLGQLLRWRLLDDGTWSPWAARMGAAILIQCRWREFLARRRVRGIAHYKKRREWASIILQGSWYKSKNAYHTFVLMSCYRAREAEDDKLQKLATRMGRFKSARKIQRRYKLRYFRRVQSSTVKVQCWYRGRSGYNYVDILRKRKWASRKLHHWARGMMRKKHAFARRIQRWWWLLKKGRLLWHLQYKAKLKDSREDWKNSEARYYAAGRIQAFIQGIWCRRWVRKYKAACIIQRPLRIFLARKRRQREKRERAIAGLRKYVESITIRAVRNRTVQLCRLHSKLMSRPQALVRGFLIRSVLFRARIFAYRMGLAVVTIQRFWRKSGAMAQAVEEIMAMRRMEMSLFKDCDRIHDILSIVKIHCGKYYDSGDPRVGLRVSSLLYRLGHTEIQNMFPRKDFLYVLNLKKLKFNDLVDLYNEWQESKNKSKRGNNKSTSTLKPKDPPRELFNTILAIVKPRLMTRRPNEVKILQQIMTIQDYMTPEECDQLVQKNFLQTFGKNLVSRAQHLGKEITEMAWGRHNNYKCVDDPLTTCQILRAMKDTTDSASVKYSLDQLRRRLPSVVADERTWDLSRTAQCAEVLQFAMDRARNVGLDSSCTIARMVESSVNTVISFRRKFSFVMMRAKKGVKPKLKKSAVTGDGSTVDTSITETTDDDATLQTESLDFAPPPALAAYEGIVVPNGKLNEVLQIDDAIALPFCGTTSDSLAMEQSVSVSKLYFVVIDKLIKASRGVQSIKNKWQNDALKRVNARARLNLFLDTTTKAYLHERNTDHVRMIWEKGRRVEAMHRRLQIIHEGIAARRQAAEEQLLELPRYGWQEIPDEVGVSYWADSIGLSDATYTKPNYTYDEYKMAMVIQKQGRKYVDSVRERRRMKEEILRREVEKAEAEWALEYTRSQKPVVIALNFSKLDVPKLLQTNLESDEASSSAVPSSLESMLPWRVQFVASPVLYAGVWALLEAEDKNSYEVVVIFKVGSNGKTCNVRTVKGNKLTDIDVKRIFQMNLEKGTKVEARYQGQTLFYRGKIIGISETHDLQTVYSIQYDDGEMEDKVARDLVRPTKTAVIDFIRNRKDLLHAAQMTRARMTHFNNQRIARLQAVKSIAQAADNSYMEAWEASEIAWDPKNKRTKPPPGSLVRTMLNASKTMQAIAYTLSIKITYVRRALKHGWKRADNLIPGQPLAYVNTITKERTALRPSYTATEEFYAKKIQSMWAVKRARKLVKKMMFKESLDSIINSTVLRCKRIAFIGFQYEGLNTIQKLRRYGYWEIAEIIENYFVSKGVNILNIKLEDIATTPQSDYEKYGIAQTAHARSLRLFQDWWSRTSPFDRENALKLINYYKGSQDPRTIVKCIKESEEAIVERFVKTFPTGVSRTRGACKTIVESLFPHSQIQLDCYIKKYSDKPELAREYVHELLNKPTTHTWVEEQEVFKLMRKAVRKIGIILGNLKLRRLRDTISAAEMRADNIMRSVPSSMAADKRPLCSGPEAKASLVLRADALDFMSRCLKAVRLLQKQFRGFTLRVQWVRNIKSRKTSLLIIQRVIRGFIHRRRAAFALKQQQSQWEQLWDPKRSILYYRNYVTGQSKYDMPEEPFRPLVRDRRSAEMLQAWPFLDAQRQKLAVSDKPEIVVVMCRTCEVRVCTRYCPECATEEDGRPFPYCFPCHALVHGDDPVKKFHQFQDATEQATKFLQCSLCSEPATRKCMGILSDSQIDTLCRELQRTPPDRWEQLFQKANIGGERKLSLLLDQVKSIKEVSAQLQQVRVILERNRAECDDCYCATCYKDVHSGGKRSQHRWLGFLENAPVCVVCTRSPAQTICQDCDTVLCLQCSNVFHKNGRKRKHRVSSLLEPCSNGDVRCNVCKRRKSTLECSNEQCDAKCCDSCFECVHKIDCDKIYCKPVDTGGLTADGDVACVVCGQPADKRCVQCQDAYCSNSWMGNPGCFVEFHSKGKRLKHTTEFLSK